MPSVDALHQIATASVNMVWLLPVKEIHAVQARQLLFSLRYTCSSGLLAAFSARTGTKGWRAYHGWPSWHFTKQIRQEVLTICNDIADPSCICLRQTTFCTCSVSTQQHGRRVHTIICQGGQRSAVLPTYRLVPCKQL